MRQCFKMFYYFLFILKFANIFDHTISAQAMILHRFWWLSLLSVHKPQFNHLWKSVPYTVWCMSMRKRVLLMFRSLRRRMLRILITRLFNILFYVYIIYNIRDKVLLQYNLKFTDFKLKLRFEFNLENFLMNLGRICLKRVF